MIPIPIFCDKKNSKYWDFAVHSGMYSSLMRDFYNICKIINDRIDTFNTLYITGHSLGGGLAKLFALQCIINNQLPKKINCSK